MSRPELGMERLAFIFAAGLLAFNAPILRMFDVVDSVFGIPVLYLYLFLSWACLIVLAAFSAETSLTEGDDDDDAGGETSLPKPGA